MLFYSDFASDMFSYMDINTIIEDRKMSKVQKICQGMAIITVASSLLSGCSQVVRTGANVALGFSEKHIERALSAAKDLVDSLTTQIEDISEAINNFPTTKKLDGKINVNGENIGTYLTFTKGEATLKADAKTTDNQAIAEDASNLKEATGNASIKIEINPTNALYSADSAIKDLKLKTNAAGNAKITIKDSEIDKLTLEYSNSLAFGLSINMDGNGGKFVIKEDIDFSKTISGADLTTASEDPEALTSLLEPEITISLKVYDDNNQVKFSKTYNSIEEFTTAFAPQEPTE